MLIDALCQITGTTENYSSAIPEPFTFIPDDQRSISLPDGSITSSFLELFGRPPRDTGLESERNNRLTDVASAAPAEFQPHPAKIEQSPKLQLPDAQTSSDPQELVSQPLPDDSFALSHRRTSARWSAPIRKPATPTARSHRWTWPGP